MVVGGKGGGLLGYFKKIINEDGEGKRSKTPFSG